MARPGRAPLGGRPRLGPAGNQQRPHPGHPGACADDATYGRHADVVTQGDHAYIFYFTHPEWQDTGMVNGLDHPERAIREQRTSIHAARLHVEGDVLVCSRDLDAPVHLDPALLDS
ncbi:hypothetical protein FCN77_01170 [Arthrobacter sp. 24S4-2]|uniref:hypothetical protein n=1 Tax=Arthrobacter sp. 24S4-2 TaxID=2575374 RepID=UPI0010C7BFF1|nr:hypothetical protein [Arthrobacter sp. 24S4-2]QCO96582.1 hypothetical protein FCN77_01170 [Arthrobacter sp. 24S4-2]